MEEQTPEAVFDEPQESAPEQVAQAAEPTVTPESPRDSAGRFVKKPHPPYLAQKAIQLGLAQQDLDGLSTNDLREMVRDIQIERLTQQRFTDVQTALERQPAPQPVAPQEPTTDVLWDDSQYDDNTKILTKTVRELREEVKNLKSKLGDIDEIKQTVRRTKEESDVQKIDSAFSGLGSAYEKVVGNTRPAKGTAELARRNAIVQHALQIIGKNGSIDDLVAQIPAAAQAIFPQQAQVEPKQSNGSIIDKWRAAYQAKPTHREGAAELNGKSKAEKTVAAFLAMNSANGEPAEDDSGDY